VNLTILKTFISIEETGSLVRASEQLNVTQSTVTARLKQLEEELGQTLVMRHKSGVVLTAAGHKLLKYARVMTGLWLQARQETSLPDDVDSLCNMGCHMDLWPDFGRLVFDEIFRERKSTALSIWPGDAAELDRWFGEGLVDAALTAHPVAHDNQTIHLLHEEQLVLYSTQPDGPIAFDPGYVFVDYGDDFRREHAAAYAMADTSRVTFGCAVWAADHLALRDGSAYLPERLAAPLVERGRLHALSLAPVFSRNVYLVTNRHALAKWSWLPDLINRLLLPAHASQAH
jgi:DNA-binding transcriptional LysR family regulator